MSELQEEMVGSIQPWIMMSADIMAYITKPSIKGGEFIAMDNYAPLLLSDNCDGIDLLNHTRRWEVYWHAATDIRYDLYGSSREVCQYG